MSEVSRILCTIDQGDSHAGARLLQLYDKLRKPAAAKLAHEIVKARVFGGLSVEEAALP
jgi:hypothetical protein